MDPDYFAFTFSAFSSFSFSFFCCTHFKGQSYCLHCLCTVHVLFTYCSWDPPPLYLEKNIKNESYGTIHQFKNYFATVFLIFSFQQNKLYPNGPLVVTHEWIQFANVLNNLEIYSYTPSKKKKKKEKKNKQNTKNYI